jgi:gas vesicle structural protein
MSTSVQPASAGQMGGRGPTGLADVIDTILDRGLVIDAYVRVSLVGIEILTIDARVVVASVDTYLRFAEAANRLDMTKSEKGVPEMIGQGRGMSQDKTKEVVQGVVEAAGDTLRELSEKKPDPAAEAEISVEQEPRQAAGKKSRAKRGGE